MAVADDSATTTQRTHRYLRLSLVLVVAALLVSVLVETVVLSWQPLTLGWNLLPSISHYFYTPARDVFVGALIAASVALLSLSGRDRATTLLDISAVFAPLIAIVPTGIGADSGLTCPASGDCVPAEYLDGVRAGIATYAIVVVAAVIASAIIRARKDRRRSTRGALLVSSIAVVTALVMAALAFVPGLNDGFPFNLWPVPSIHFAVTLLFFGTFAAVPLLRARESTTDVAAPRPTARQRTVYRWIGWLLIADLVLLVVALVLAQVMADVPLVLLGEAAALILFAWFWWVQTFERWDDPDPPSIAQRRIESWNGFGSSV